MREIKKINKLSFAKMFSIFYAITGFFIFLITTLLVILNIITQDGFQGSIIITTFFHIAIGGLFGIIIGLVSGLIGWISGYILAIIYNLIALKFGGVEIEFIEKN